MLDFLVLDATLLDVGNWLLYIEYILISIAVSKIIFHI